MVADYVRKTDKRNDFSKGYTSNQNRKIIRVNQLLKTQPPTYTIENMDGERVEGKNSEQEILKSDFDFESNNRVLEPLNVDLRS